MKAEDVTATLDLALEASGCDCATVVAQPRFLSDNGSSYIEGTWRITSATRAWIMSEARHTTHKPKARSSGSTRP